MLVSGSYGIQLSAARSLSALNREIVESKLRLKTGTKLLKPSDNFELWRVSSAMKSRASALALLRTDLNSAGVITARGSAALVSAKETLQSIRGLLTSTKADGVDLGTIQRQLVSAGKTLTGLAQQASVAGINILTGLPQTLSFRASTAENGTSYTIDLDKGRTILFGAGSEDGILETPFDLSGLAQVENDGSMLLGLSGDATATAGLDAVPLNTDGLGGGNAAIVTGQQYRDATAASFSMGDIHKDTFGSGDRLQFRLRIEGVSHDITVVMPGTQNYETFRSRLQTSIDAAVGSSKVTVNMTTNGMITLRTVATGASASIAVGGVAMADGNGTVTSTGGLTAPGTYSTQKTDIGGAQRIYTSLGAFSTTGIDNSDRIRVQLNAFVGGQQYNGSVLISLSGVTTTSTFATRLNNALAANADLSGQVGAAVVDGKVVIHLKGEGDSLRVSAVTGVDGNGSVVSNPSLSSGSALGRNAVERQAASVKSVTSFTDPLTILERGSISYDFTRNGVTTSIVIRKSDVDAALGSVADYTLGSGYIKDVEAFSKVIQHSLQTAGISDVAVRPSFKRLYFYMTGEPVDGDRIGFGNVVDTVPPTQATLITGSEFSEPIALDSTQTITFVLSLNGQPATQIRIDRNTIDAVLGSEPGHSSSVIANAGELARVVQRAVSDAGLPPIDVTAAGNRLLFKKRAAGAATLAISDVALQEKAAIEDGTNLFTFDLTSDTLVGLSRKNFMDHIDVVASNIDAIIQRVSSAKDHTDAVSDRIASQAGLSTKLEGIFRKAYGEMVDVDMNAEKARLKALEIRQAFLKKSISITNESAKNILILFEDWPAAPGKPRA